MKLPTQSIKWVNKLYYVFTKVVSRLCLTTPLPYDKKETKARSSVSEAALFNIPNFTKPDHREKMNLTSIAFIGKLQS